MHRLLSGLLLCMPMLASALCPTPLRVPFEDWKPYSFLDAEGRHQGLETELLAAVAQAAGCQVRYVSDVPRNRRMPMLIAGDLDLLIAATPVPTDAAWYTLPYRDERFGAFMRKEDARMQARSMQDLLAAGLRLLTHRGPASAPVIQEFQARGRLTRFEDYAKGVQLMQRRRGDVLLGDSLAIAYAARRANVDLVELPFAVTQGPVSYKLGRTSMNEAQLRAFNEAIQRLEAQGELQRIRARWARPATVAPAAPATPAPRR